MARRSSRSSAVGGADEQAKGWHATPPPSAEYEAGHRGGRLPREEAKIFRKTKMCKFQILGMCNKGNECAFAHSQEEMEILPDLSCTKICKTLINTGSCEDPHCAYAHNKEELRQLTGYQAKEMADPRRLRRNRGNRATKVREQQSQQQQQHAVAPAVRRQSTPEVAAPAALPTFVPMVMPIASIMEMGTQGPKLRMMPMAQLTGTNESCWAVGKIAPRGYMLIGDMGGHDCWAKPNVIVPPGEGSWSPNPAPPPIEEVIQETFDNRAKPMDTNNELDGDTSDTSYGPDEENFADSDSSGTADHAMPQVLAEDLQESGRERCHTMPQSMKITVKNTFINLSLEPDEQTDSRKMRKSDSCPILKSDSCPILC